MSHKFFIIRHAQTFYNKAQELSESQNIPHDSGEFRWDPSLMDSYLSPAGILQCESAISHIHSLQINQVFVSPLRRALQTCQILFKSHPCSPKITVFPDLHEICGNGHDVSVYPSTLLQEFHEFDWGLVPEDFASWGFIDERFKEELSSTGFGASEVLGLMRKYKEESLESYERLFERAQRTKSVWREELNLGSVAIVTHSAFLREFTKREFGMQGDWLQNCECREYDLSG